MDVQQAALVNEAAQRFPEAIVLTNRTTSDRLAEARDRPSQLARSFVERVIGNPRPQEEGDRFASPKLAEQALRGQEVSRVLPEQDLPEQGRRPTGHSMM